MKQITFPESERKDIQRDIDRSGRVWSVRVSREYGRYSPGETLNSVFGKFVVEKRFKISGGIEELRRDYIHFSELNDEMLAELRRYSKMDVICLRKT